MTTYELQTKCAEFEKTEEFAQMFEKANASLQRKIAEKGEEYVIKTTDENLLKMSATLREEAGAASGFQNLPTSLLKSYAVLSAVMFRYKVGEGWN